MIYENMSVSGSLKVDRVTARPPKGVKSQRPTNPLSGSLFLEESSEHTSYLMVYTGVSNIDEGWERISAQQNEGTNFKYRQIINYSYMAGGYKSSSPWKNVHKATNATDQTTHIGELLDYPANYTSGACSKSIFYMWSVNTDNAHKGPTTLHSNTTSAVNMMTDTNYAHQSNHDLQYSRSDCGTMWKEHEFAWIFAGNRTEVDKFNLSNETTITNYGVTSISSSGGASSFCNETHGYGWSTSSIKMEFSTETISSSSSSWSVHGQQKGIPSKVGKGYAGNEGSYQGGYNLRRWDTSTDTNIGNIPKLRSNCGEENFAMGQDWQYMLGCYGSSLQNNDSWKMYYQTDTGVLNPAGLPPAVNAGTSSGHCAWRE